MCGLRLGRWWWRRRGRWNCLGLLDGGGGEGFGGLGDGMGEMVEGIWSREVSVYGAFEGRL